jgi:hypothetical protein
MLRRDSPEGQPVFPGLLHQGGSGGELLAQHSDHLIPLLLHRLDPGLHEHRAQGVKRH